MTDYSWTELRADAIGRFGGDTPGAELEQRLIEAFRDHPQIVAASIDHVAARYDAGIVRNGWAVLDKQISEAVRDVPELRATDSSDRNKRIRNAEQWIRTAGLHFDRGDEILDELFGDHGMLKAWHADEPLRSRMLALWLNVRPGGENVEAEALERAGKWRSQREDAAAVKARTEEYAA